MNLRSRADLDLGTIDLDLVLRVMEAAKRTNIVLLDACRDNPLIENLAAKMGTRGLAVGRGLAQVNSGVGTLIAYATQPGNVALDGRGRNSPFTAALLRTVEKPGLSLTDLMVEVRNEVLRDTDGRQVPWDHSSLTGPFYFTAPPPPPLAQDGASPAALDLAFWDSIKDSNNARLFEAYLKRYPGGAFADIARIRLDATANAAAKPLTEAPSDTAAVSGAKLAELKERLYELNFDPDTAGERSLRGSIREFETQTNLPATGEPTDGLLRRLRSIGGLKPWGAIVYDKAAGAWGMSWGSPSRRAAVAEARAKCKGAACPVELSFYGTGCAAFAQTGGSWAIVARDSLDRSRQAALDDCGRRGRRCQIIGAVCADGAGHNPE